MDSTSANLGSLNQARQNLELALKTAPAQSADSIRKAIFHLDAATKRLKHQQAD